MRTKKHEAVGGFNHTVKQLILKVREAARLDEARLVRVIEIQNKIALAIDVFPMSVVDAVGSLLLKYQKQTQARDEKFFLENNYEEEFKVSVNEEKVQAVKFLMPLIKTVWAGLDPAKRVGYWELIDVMILYYLDYLLYKSMEPR